MILEYGRASSMPSRDDSSSGRRWRQEQDCCTYKTEITDKVFLWKTFVSHSFPNLRLSLWHDVANVSAQRVSMLNKSSSQARAGDAVEKVREMRPAPPNVVRIDAAQKDNPLESFKSELPRWRTLSWNKGTIAVLAGTVLVVGVSVGAAALYLGAAAPGLGGVRVPSLSGHVTLNSRPDGVVVFVDGVARGVTPVEIDLPAGPHEVVFAEGAMERRLPLKVEAGARLSENVDLPSPAGKAGQLEVTSDPQGARVTLDGTHCGV